MNFSAIFSIFSFFIFLSPFFIASRFYTYILFQFTIFVNKIIDFFFVFRYY
nr:MAG TPA: hypothetical protein [Caudoviricetes sp.]